MSTIYMYHSIGSGDEIANSDPHYAVSVESFSSHISAIGKSIPLAFQIKDNGGISEHCITFDDGHISNYEIAFPLLMENNLSAEFYVNTSLVGKKYYVSWSQLNDMKQQGMSIQSHGHTHSYFSDLSASEINRELDTSKKLIEDKLQQSVIVFAPPGGRYDRRVVNIAKELGYRCIANSAPGTCSNSHGFIVPRFAVLASTSTSTISNFKNGSSVDALKETIKYRIFSIAKFILGNKSYDKIRSRLLD